MEGKFAVRIFTLKHCLTIWNYQRNFAERFQTIWFFKRVDAISLSRSHLLRSTSHRTECVGFFFLFMLLR